MPPQIRLLKWQIIATFPHLECVQPCLLHIPAHALHMPVIAHACNSLVAARTFGALWLLAALAGELIHLQQGSN